MLLQICNNFFLNSLVFSPFRDCIYTAGSKKLKYAMNRSRGVITICILNLVNSVVSVARVDLWIFVDFCLCYDTSRATSGHQQNAFIQHLVAEKELLFVIMLL